MRCFFVTDLHGKPERYDILFRTASAEKPDAVLMGGDILPGGYGRSMDPDGFWKMLSDGIGRARKSNPDMRLFVILGNDDPRANEGKILELEAMGMLEYVHGRSVPFGDLHVAGYSFVPPTPFLLKDWERYDVSRFTGLGCVSPEEGRLSVDVPPETRKYSTIQKDLEELSSLSPPEKTIYLFHSPPFETCLDRVGNDGKMIDHAPADLHVGSIAIKRFIEKRNPLLTLHGHIHESVRLTGCWSERIGGTHALGGAHDGPGLALVRFDTDDIAGAEREIIPR